MYTIKSFLENVSRTIEKKGIEILRISVGAVFFWFGFLKFFGSTSAAEEIASKTISLITFEYLKPEASMPILAILECVIGIGILTKKYMQYIIPVMYFQMAGTLLPLFVFIDETWHKPFVPTLLGQYIIKNCILISAAIVLGVTSKGGKLIADPVVAKKAKAAEKNREEL